MSNHTQRSFELINTGKAYFARALSTRLGQNTMWALGGYGLRLFIQAAYFIIIARYLGAGSYGAFIAVTALISAISPFVGVGSGNLLVKNVARDNSLFQAYWGNGLLMIVCSGLLLLAIVVTLSRFLLPREIPSLVLVLVGVSDLIFVRVLDLAAWAFQAWEMLAHNAHLNVLISLTRLIGIAGLALAASHATVTAWSAVYLAGSVVAALISVCWITLKFGRPRLALRRVRNEILEGLYFSVGVAAQTFYNDIDKVMVARLSTLEAAGIYAAAYRLIDVAFIPIRALLNAAYPAMFRRGAAGLKHSLHLGRRLLVRSLAYPVFIFGALLVAAPVVPRVLGHGFSEATEALRWLSLLPLLKTIHYFVSDALTGAGHQGLRTLTQVGVAIFNTLINLWLIPAYGWRGAAWSSLASDGLLAIALWSIALWLCGVKRSQDTRGDLLPAERIEQEA
jgi:O-antigen/teichoic acid export membrane protein